MLKALIFDVDGTLADTEDAHRRAFNAAFRDMGLDWHWDTALYARLLDVAGGKERLRRHGQLDANVVDAVHASKTRHYAALADRLPLRPGILRLLRTARNSGVPLALATTTTPDNIDALLRTRLGRHWRAYFAAVCDGSTPGAKKPAPDVYRAVLAQLDVPARACLAFEDSSNGVRAAQAAGIAVVVTPTAYTRGQSFDGALVLPHLGGVQLAALAHHLEHIHSGDRHAPHPDAVPDRRAAPLSACQRRLQ